MEILVLATELNEIGSGNSCFENERGRVREVNKVAAISI